MVWSWFVHDAQPEELRLGDHIYKWGSPLHTHHGLVYQILEAPSPQIDPDAENLLDRIIVLHLSFSTEEKREAKIHRVPLRTFLAGDRKGQQGLLKRARYSVPWAENMVKLPGTCYSMHADAPAVALRRAQALLELTELRPYDLSALTFSNCEHVIVWCKTGHWRSAQVDGAFGLAGTAALLAGAAAAARSPGAGLLPLLGGVLLWQVARIDGAVDAEGVPPALACGGRAILGDSASCGDELVSFSLAEGELVVGGAALAELAGEACHNSEGDEEYLYVGSEDEADFVMVSPEGGSAAAQRRPVCA
mmetsp:Transcript_41607/g.107652  ORF Transcript_41607/g.107652 Transcript_41607/m.107652 type:complete len:306 (-) Transcript_41607:94-1011(-)